MLGGMLEDLAVMHPAEAWNVLVEGDLGPSASAAPMCRAHSGGHCFSITLEFGWLLLHSSDLCTAQSEPAGDDTPRQIIILLSTAIVKTNDYEVDFLLG